MLPLPPPITSRTNARVKALRASLSGEARRPGDLLGLEGEHLIGEAHRAGFQFDTVYLREGSEDLLLGDHLPIGLRTERWAVLSREVFDSAATTTTPQGIAATVFLRQPAAFLGAPESALVLEDVQDPGNVGTLIRSSQAFGIQQVMVTPGTANHWNPKVVRSAAGSIFHVPISRAPIETIAEQLRGQGVRIFAAVAHFTGKHMLAAEHGVLTGRVEDPAAPSQERTPGSSNESYAASISWDTDILPPFAILVGNEGAGLSAQARNLADEQVLIPCGGSESLNAAVAGSILLYEAMRQKPLRHWARNQGLRP